MADSGLNSLFALRLRGEADIAQSVVGAASSSRIASRWGPPHQLWQLGEVRRDAPGLVLGEQLSSFFDGMI